jgi:hypothetical protein
MLACPDPTGGWTIIDPSAGQAFILREGEQRGGVAPDDSRHWRLEHGRILFNEGSVVIQSPASSYASMAYLTRSSPIEALPSLPRS